METENDDEAGVPYYPVAIVSIPTPQDRAACDCKVGAYTSTVPAGSPTCDRTDAQAVDATNFIATAPVDSDTPGVSSMLTHTPVLGFKRQENADRWSFSSEASPSQTTTVPLTTAVNSQNGVTLPTTKMVNSQNGMTLPTTKMVNSQNGMTLPTTKMCLKNATTSLPTVPLTQCPGIPVFKWTNGASQTNEAAKSCWPCFWSSRWLRYLSMKSLTCDLFSLRIMTTCGIFGRLGRNGYSHHGFGRSTQSVFLVLLLVFLYRPTIATMDITAFEYQRKFHKALELGECAQREVVVDLGNNTVHIEEQKCTMEQKGVVTHLPRELDDTRNVLIPSAEAIVAYLGLCGGEAASFLGILNTGDCVAVEIASQLTFTDKTVVRAFVGYFRRSLDILEFSTDNNKLVEGMDHYYKDKYFLKNRSYGTLEIIFVQFRFDTIREASAARSVQLSSPVMSAYMRHIHDTVGTPKHTVVISLSTASQSAHTFKHFKHDDWPRAVRYVEILELSIEKTKELINTDVIKPHLQYHLQPFIDSGEFRLTKPILWEKISMLEVQLRQSANLAKKTTQKCRKNKTKLCNRVRELHRQLVATQAEVHKGRSSWLNLTAEEKDFFSTRFTVKVNSYSSVTKNLAKNVREMKKKEKEELDRKQNQMNQVPVDVKSSNDTQQSSPPLHRIRHSKNKARIKYRMKKRLKNRPKGKLRKGVKTNKS